LIAVSKPLPESYRENVTPEMQLAAPQQWQDGAFGGTRLSADCAVAFDF